MSTFHLRWARYTVIPCRSCGEPEGKKCRIMKGERKGELARFPHVPRMEDSISMEIRLEIDRANSQG
jgi:hypothetical protein